MQSILKRLYQFLCKKKINREYYKTFKEWNVEGYYVRKGEKAMGVGIECLFSKQQVSVKRRRIQKGIAYEPEEFAAGLDCYMDEVAYKHHG